MKPGFLPIGAALMALGACAPAYDPATLDPALTNPSVPESVFELAATYQNVATARVLPEDGCYWYVHEGPVETTLLPLRTPEGKPICTASHTRARR